MQKTGWDVGVEIAHAEFKAIYFFDSGGLFQCPVRVSTRPPAIAFWVRVGDSHWVDAHWVDAHAVAIKGHGVKHSLLVWAEVDHS